ncbi:hypothetical protein Ddye_025851 [Dipteronia dyeriana]|uniref:Uncharacterized protein n=1 Tax=Dipteronia dyeriana TaxID=168575 RepID=A0AAD9WNX4_9ROSI|nr:hypothetical protein Ddye_025851 [Dipteronia dyeriana]
MIRRRYNKLEGLKGDYGIWMSDKRNMKAIVISYFLTLFFAQPILDRCDNLPCYFHGLADKMYDYLHRVINEEDVKSAIFGIGGLKDPGPNGLPAMFF